VFLAAAEAAGFQQLAGHRTSGGLRASLYNAMPMAGAEALAAFMTQFDQQHGRAL
jgi:phosphoserine aminotransferase